MCNRSQIANIIFNFFFFNFVAAQMFLMNRFFDGEFMTFGLDVIAHMDADQEDRLDPMIYIFPRMTKCTFYKYGVSGEVIILFTFLLHMEIKTFHRAICFYRNIS